MRTSAKINWFTDAWAEHPTAISGKGYGFMLYPHEWPFV